MPTKPLAVFYTGTNGSGKSTLRLSQQNPHLHHIDADAIAKTLAPHDPRSVDIAAGKEATRQFNHAILHKRSFSFETTLTGKSILNKIQQAKDSGFHVEIYYLVLKNADVNISRVAYRVLNGGHHIASEVIKRRYEESLKNLPKVALIADSLMVKDNTVYPTDIFSIEQGVITLHHAIPTHLEGAFTEIALQFQHI